MQVDTFSAATAAIEQLIVKSKPDNSTTMKSAIVALFSSDGNGELVYSNCIGLLQLDKDRSLKTFVLRFYNIQTLEMVFQVQLYYGFYDNYKIVNPTFYVFEYNQGLIGLQYRNKDDADIMNIKIKSNSPPMSEFDTLKKRRIEEAKKKKEEGSFFNKVKGFFGGEKQEEHVQKASQVISVKKGVYFDTKTGQFNTQNADKDWQNTIKKLNLKPQDLKNKEITNLIVQQTILQQARVHAEKKQDKQLIAKLKQVDEEQRQYEESMRHSIRNNLPPPPPMAPTLLVPPQLSANRGSYSSKRANLLDEIRNNKIQLAPVSKNTGGGIDLDISNMNNEEKNDHVERIRNKLKMRKAALNRRQASDDQD